MTANAPRLHPQAVEMERAVLGGLIKRPDLLPVVQAHVDDGDWFEDRHRELWRLLCRMAERGEAIDTVSLPERVMRTGSAGRFGGIAYLLDLPDAAVSTSNLDYYAKVIRQKAAARRLMGLGDELVRIASEDQPDVEDRAAEVLTGISDAIAGSARQGPPPTVTELLERKRAREARGERLGGFLPTGIAGLDHALGGGLPLRQVTLVAGHPSHGKSALALAIAGSVATRYAPDVQARYVRGADVDLRHVPGVGVFSLEMDGDRVLARITGALSGVDHKTMRHGGKGVATPADQRAWAEAEERLEAAPLYVYDARRATVPEIRAKALYMDARLRAAGFAGLRLLILDYIQKVSPRDHRQKRNEAVAEMSEAVYELTAQLGCASLVLAQPNRSALDTADPRPKLWHLAESAYLERDTDVALMVFWPSRSDPKLNESTERYRYEVSVAKNRDGQSGSVVNLWYSPRGMTFRDPTPAESEGWKIAADARRGAPATTRRRKARPDDDRPAPSPSKPRRTGPMPAHPDDDPALAEADQWLPDEP